MELHIYNFIFNRINIFIDVITLGKSKTHAKMIGKKHIERIELIRGHWYVNSKKLIECTEDERRFFGKFIKLNQFAETRIFNQN